MEYRIEELTKEEARSIEAKAGEYDDPLAVPADGAPEDEALVLKIEDKAGRIIAGCAGIR